MKTTGQILKEARLQKKLELSDVARITKIRSDSLQILEADDYGHLPGSTVARGFIKNYAKFLGLNPDNILAVFRRDFVENQLGQIVPRGMVDPVNNRSWWTPKSTILASVVMLFVVFSGYLFYQYRILIGPPSLQLVKPVENMLTDEDTVEITGATDPEATLSVNSQPVVLGKGGLFYLRVPLKPGANYINIVATGKSGKITSISRTVTLTSPP